MNIIKYINGPYGEENGPYGEENGLSPPYFFRINVKPMPPRPNFLGKTCYFRRLGAFRGLIYLLKLRIFLYFATKIEV